MKAVYRAFEEFLDLCISQYVSGVVVGCGIFGEYKWDERSFNVIITLYMLEAGEGE